MALSSPTSMPRRPGCEAPCVYAAMRRVNSHERWKALYCRATKTRRASGHRRRLHTTTVFRRPRPDCWIRLRLLMNAAAVTYVCIIRAGTTSRRQNAHCARAQTARASGHNDGAHARGVTRGRWGREWVAWWDWTRVSIGVLGVTRTLRLSTNLACFNYLKALTKYTLVYGHY